MGETVLHILWYSSSLIIHFRLNEVAMVRFFSEAWTTDYFHK